MSADAEYVLEGLEEPAEILVDRWGVPHVYASSLYDASRLQGFKVARDRLWQLVPLPLPLGEPDLGRELDLIAATKTRLARMTAEVLGQSERSMIDGWKKVG